MAGAVLGSGEIRFAIAAVGGRPGVTPTLVIDCELTALGYHPGAAAVLFAEIHAWFSSSNAFLGMTSPLPVVLGYPVGQQFVGQPNLPAPLHEQLQVVLDAGGVMRLEELRRGDDLRLQVRVTALLTSTGVPDPDAPAPAGLRPQGSSHPLGHWQEEHRVTREQWLSVLASWGVGVAVPLGVAIPGQLIGPDRLTVVKELHDGVVRLHSGDVTGSLTASRKAVELLRTMIADPEPLPKSIKERTAGQRRIALAQALFDLTSAAVHPDPVVRDERWTREDALLAVAAAAALAQRVFRD